MIDRDELSARQKVQREMADDIGQTRSAVAKALQDAFDRLVKRVDELKRGTDLV